MICSSHLSSLFNRREECSATKLSRTKTKERRNTSRTDFSRSMMTKIEGKIFLCKSIEHPDRTGTIDQGKEDEKRESDILFGIRSVGNKHSFEQWRTFPSIAEHWQILLSINDQDSTLCQDFQWEKQKKPFSARGERWMIIHIGRDQHHPSFEEDFSFFQCSQ